MKFAASVVLGLLVISAAQGKSLNPWERKAQQLEVRFEKAVNDKANAIIEKVKNAVHYAQEHSKDFIDEIEREINATIAQAIQEIDVLKHDVDLECYTNATKDIYAAQEAAITNLAGCQNLSIAYQDIQEIAQNASTVVLDVVQDAKTIIEGVQQCSSLSGFDKWKCAVEVTGELLKELVSQWPDAKAFIAVVQTLGTDVELQINTCLNDPTQQSLDNKVQLAIDEFTACSTKSSSRYASYVV